MADGAGAPVTCIDLFHFQSILLDAGDGEGARRVADHLALALSHERLAEARDAARLEQYRMKPTGGHAGVVMRGERRAHLEDVRHVKREQRVDRGEGARGLGSGALEEVAARGQGVEVGGDAGAPWYWPFSIVNKRSPS